MTIRLRIILGFLTVTSVCFLFFVRWILNDVKPRYMEAFEEPLVDVAYLLAAQLSTDSDSVVIDTNAIQRAVAQISTQEISAQIYSVTKSKIDLSVYVTDEKGIVLYDSAEPQNVGKSYLDWRDVNRSLRGEYGARSTRRDPNDPSSGVLYVSAPIRRDGIIRGVVSVGKPKIGPYVFIRHTEQKILFASAIAILGIIVLSILLSWTITRPIEKLTAYVRKVRDGERPKPPALAGEELGQLVQAFEEMRAAVDGTAYVEQYVQTLTHELKSPLAAIQGAAELLQENMSQEDRTRFLENIKNESTRMSDLISKMLSQTVLEKRLSLSNPVEIELKSIAEEVTASFEVIAKTRNVTLSLSPSSQSFNVTGDPFLLRQAISNLVQNALDFTPQNGAVTLSVRQSHDTGLLTVQDNGPGIPDYAKERVFERFYSLARPSSGRRSTGLGLPFVREVASLHQGTIELQSSETGTLAVLKLPIAS